MPFRGRRARLAVPVTFAALAAVALLLGRSFFETVKVGKLDEAVRSKAAAYLKRELGESAELADLSLGWRFLVVEGIRLPLDSSGSFVTVKRIRIDVDPLAAINDFAHLERVARAIEFEDAAFFLRVGHNDSPEVDSGRSWSAGARIPDGFFALFERFDSLKHIRLASGSLTLGLSDSSWSLAERVSGELHQVAAGRYRLELGGACLGRSRGAFGVSGTLDAESRRFEVTGNIAVPEFGNGGAFNAPVTARATDIHYSYLSSNDGIELTVDGRIGEIVADFMPNPLRCNVGQIHVQGDTLRVAAKLEIENTATASVGATLVCRGEGHVSGASEVDLRRDSELLAKLNLPVDRANPLIPIHVQFGGTLRRPEFEVSAADTIFTAGGISVSNMDAAFYLDGEGVKVESCSLDVSGATINLSGKLPFKPDGEVDAKVSAEFFSGLWIADRRLQVRSFDGQVSGALKTPQVSGQLQDGLGSTLATVQLSHGDNGWIFAAGTPGGEGTLDGEFDPSIKTLTMRFDRPYGLWSALTGDTSRQYPIAEARLTFSGDKSGGVVFLHASAFEDSSGWLPRVASRADFQGSYRRDESDRYLMVGKWNGLSNDSTEFTGRATLTYANQVIEFEKCYVDAAGELSGKVDLSKRSLDLRVEIVDLPYSRFPLRTEWGDRTGLNGTLSGHAVMAGPIERPDWSLELGLIDGAIFGVPGYWANLSASGAGDSILIDRLSLGRDVRRIFDVRGQMDISRDTLALYATATRADANDFIAALTGNRGWLSGQLAGNLSATGRLSSPDVTADFAVEAGELLAEVYFDQLMVQAELRGDTTGVQWLRVPRFDFYKRGEYEFSADAGVSLAPNGPLQVNLFGQGDFLDLVDQVDRTFTSHGSEGVLDVSFGGTTLRPRFEGAELVVRNGQFTYSDATPEKLDFEMDVRVSAAAMVERGFLRFSSAAGNSLQLDILPANSEDSSHGLRPILIPTPNVMLGVLRLSTGTSGVVVRLPGLMKPEWTGVLRTSAETGGPCYVSMANDSCLLFTGNVELRNSRMTFPLVAGSGTLKPVAQWLVNRLTEASWDMSVRVESGNHYDVEMTNLRDSDLFAPLRDSPLFSTLAAYFDHISVDAIVEPAESPIDLRGRISDSTFFLYGSLGSRRGRVDYLDQTFTIDRVQAEFDGTSIMPIIEGRASTTGTDSLGRAVPVHLTMYQIDRENDIRAARGRFDQITFVLEADAGQTQEDVLQLLGYSVGGLSTTAGRLVTSTLARAIGREWLDPIERKLERWTWLDEVAISPGGGQPQSLTRQTRARAQEDTLRNTGVVRYLLGSQFSVGKYLSDDVLFTYTGELAEAQQGIEAGRLGLVHLWNIEYRIDPVSRDLVLDCAVEYDEVERRRDESISLKYSFALEAP